MNQRELRDAGREDEKIEFTYPLTIKEAIGFSGLIYIALQVMQVIGESPEARADLCKADPGMIPFLKLIERADFTVKDVADFGAALNCHPDKDYAASLERDIMAAIDKLVSIRKSAASN